MARVQINQPHQHPYTTYEPGDYHTFDMIKTGINYPECSAGILTQEVTVAEAVSADKETTTLKLASDGLEETGINFDNDHDHTFLQPPSSFDLIALETMILDGSLAVCSEGHADCKMSSFTYWTTSGYQGVVIPSGDLSLEFADDLYASRPWYRFLNAINHSHYHQFYGYQSAANRYGYTHSACPLGHNECLMALVFANKALLRLNTIPYVSKTGTADFSGQTVSGSGTLFTTEFSIGDWICPSSRRTYPMYWRKIDNIISDISLTVEASFPYSQQTQRPYRWDGATGSRVNVTSEYEANE